MPAFGYCLNASTIRGTPVLRQIEVAAKGGYGAIELWFDDIDEALHQGVTLEDIRRKLDDCGIVAATLIYLGDWFDAAMSDWPKTRALCRHRLEQAAALGAHYVIAGPPPGSADLTMGARRFRKLLEVGESAGALPSMEFLGFVEQFKTIETALKVIERAGHPLGTIVVDPFHVFRGGDTMESLAMLRGTQIAIAHFNDAPVSPPAHAQHDGHRVWPGEGHLDLRRYCELLTRAGYHGWLSLELFREELWRQDPVEVARVGLEKMRSVVEA
jgi:sugar phosphate isomerase/epimerase